MISFTSLFAQERGKASFYSNRIHGRRMADGTRYDKAGFTCAHKEYPFGTLLKVTNLSNGKSVIVEVRDRGPYSRNRMIDLSYSAAKEIGMIRQGVALVEVEEVEENQIPLLFDINCGLKGVNFLMPHEYLIPVLDYPNYLDSKIDIPSKPAEPINIENKHKSRRSTDKKGRK